MGSDFLKLTVNIFKKCRAWEYLNKFAQLYDTIQIGVFVYSIKKGYFLLCHTGCV